ncbi:hypothetical protein AGMMS50249_5780 [candidate division SR1 bacterium]|nr:hypothetical protein AGMMS50249_5780 [candidate division SR1 bacterium]
MTIIKQSQRFTMIKIEQKNYKCTLEICLTVNKISKFTFAKITSGCHIPHFKSQDISVICMSRHHFPCVVESSSISLAPSGLILRVKGLEQKDSSTKIVKDLLDADNCSVLVVSKIAKKQLVKESCLDEYENRIFCYAGSQKQRLTNLCQANKNTYHNHPKNYIK